jgi:FO synthase subunit 1
LKKILQRAGWELVPRLPVYPQFDSWLSQELQQAVSSWRNNLKLANFLQKQESKNLSIS